MTYARSILDTAYSLVMHMSMRVVLSLMEMGAQVVSVYRMPQRVRTLHAAPVLDKSHSDAVAHTTDASVSVRPHTLMYTKADTTPLYRDPTTAFDSQVATIPYGSLVLMMEAQGRFYRIVWHTHEGWVLKDDLADRASAVYPQFIEHEENDAQHQNTLRVRACIGDMFGLSHSGFPLQAGEYVAYKLLRRGIVIPWTSVRPRTPGSWHVLLKGVRGVHMSVLPKAGAILEYTHEDTGHVAYVEAVFPDQTIAISEVNYSHGGIYTERALTQATWKSLRPVFIEVAQQI